MKALIGRKIGMTQILREDGVSIPVTVLQAGPCVVTAIKTEEVDGYSAVQIGFEEDKKPKKAQQGQNKKAKTTPKYLREFRTDDAPELGSELNVETFEEGEKVVVSGTSKGKGFAGTVKRHNFNTGPKSHGSRNYRKPGSIGSMYPQKVFKGKKMAGQMGYDKNTVKNLKVAAIDKENNLISIVGAIPGPSKGIITIAGVK